MDKHTVNCQLLFTVYVDISLDITQTNPNVDGSNFLLCKKQDEKFRSMTARALTNYMA